MISKRRILAAVLATSMLVCGIPNVTKAIEYNGATSGNSATSGDTSSDGNTSSSGNTASDGNTSSSGNIASDGNVQEKGKPEITFAIGEDLLINDNGKEYISSEKFSENEDENPKLKVKVKDEKSKISNIIIKVNETEVINNAYKETEQTDETEVDVTLLKNDIVNNAFVINVKAVNANGVETEGEKTIYADVNAPEISENEATIEGGNYVNDIYVGNKIKASININSKNEGNDSSLREVEFYLAKDKDNIKNLADENKVVLQKNANTTLDYKMDENNKEVYSGYLAVCVKDMCGNVTYKLLSKYKVILENVNPTCSLEIVSNNYYKATNGEKWIKADDSSSIEYKYEINDDNSGIKEYIIKVNNEAISGTEEIEKNSNVEEYTEDGFNKKITGSFKLEGYKPNNEGKYVISIVATDNAGNEIEAATDIINVDDAAPNIDGKVKFKNNPNKDENYIYGNEDVTVSFKVKDGDLGSGIDIDKIEIYKSGDNTDKIKCDEATTEIDENGEVTCTIKAPAEGEDAFENYMYAKLYDNVGNYRYVDLSNKKLILEKNKPEIKVTKSDSIYNNWFNSDVVYKIEITDNESGIDMRELENEKNAFKVEIDGEAVLLNSDSFKKEEKNNKVTSITGKFLAKESVIIDLKVKDNAGNETDTITEDLDIQIDRDAPGVINDTTTFYKGNKKITPIEGKVYSNNTVTVNFKVTDTTPSSGISKVEVYAVDKNSKDDTSKYEKIENVNFLTTDGKVTFEVAGTDDKYKYYYAKVYDNAENISDYILLSENGLLIESKAPEVEKLESSEENGEYTVGKAKWINGNGVTYNYEIKDDKNVTNYSGIASYTIKVQGPNDENLITIYPTEDKKYNFKELVSSVSGNFKFTPKEPGKYTIKIEMMDNAGNTSTYTYEVNADLDTPEVKPESVKFENITKISDNIYANNTVKVNFEVTDAEPSSGISKVEVYAVDKNSKDDTSKYEKIENVNFLTTDGKVTFEVAGTDDKYKYYYAKVYDNAENISDYILLSENGLLIESKAPEVEKLESSEENGEYTVGKAKWINGNGVTYNYEIKDDKNVTNYSGIASYTIKVQGPNDENLITIYPTEDKKYNFKELVSSVSGNFKFTPKEPGKYTIIIEMMDNAGNTNVYKHEVNADLSMPTASKFSMSFDKYAEGNSESVKTEKYGYYFKSKAQVTVTLTDDGHSSGIREAAYFLYDVKNNMSASDFVKAGNYNTTTKINNNQITIDIPENFKGQIYVAAIDNVGNGDFTNINNYTKPAGIIIDDNRNDKDVIAINRLKTSFKDNSGLDLYNKDIQVGFNIKDVTSGIRRIDWNVSSANGGESNYSGYMEINNDGKISGNNDNYNVITKEQNLITSLAKSISVGNNDNAITVTIKVEDRAGNISYATDTFSIDKTTPEITIAYDNNTPDVANSKMFKADRKATITVRERNFNPKDVVIDIKNTDGVIPVLSDWRVINGTGNGDNTTYTASISYVNDGDYTFAMGYQDNAANVANINFTAGTVEATEFTIDKTRPTLSVQYNNNSATNGNYYLDQRIATFTIVEHNFDASRFELSISRNGAASQQSVNWTNNGDTHTASIALDEEVLYNIFANYTDMAGNAIEGTYNAEFYVDKKAPDLIISGIDNEKAYRDGRVGFVISSSDTYFDSVSISLELLNRDGSTTTLISNNDERANVHIDYQNIENGRKLSVENLETDGIYRLMCRATDKAGRVTENNVLFSININGPTYYIDDEATLNIKDKYLVSPQDIVFNEINVNELKPDTIKITVYRGNTTWDLVEGRDYTVEKVEGIDKWCKYRYIISKDNFKENGIYHVTIASKDIVENDAISEKFSFVIDNEPPVCTVFDLKAGNVYVTNSKDVRFKVTDNIELDSLIVLLDGKEIMKLSGDDIKKNVSEDGTIKITIPSSNKAQNLVIKYTDKSGNESETEVKGFYITTNLWIRFINNKPLVISICCAIAAIIILIILIIIRKNKKDNKKTNTKAVSNKKE